MIFCRTSVKIYEKSYEKLFNPTRINVKTSYLVKFVQWQRAF